MVAAFPAPVAVGLAAPGLDVAVVFAVLDAAVPYQMENRAIFRHSNSIAGIFLI